MSAPYGELVVVLGDAHVGHRAADIPEKFKKMLSPDKMQHLVSTGNLCASETYEFFRSVAPRMYAVRGDMDDYSSSMTSSEELVFEVGEFRIGVCHGHQIVPWGDREALGLLARRLSVDILISGHTHVCEAFEVEGTWFINPGSITGAYTPLRDNILPSFVLLSIQANTVKLYMYELNGVSGEVDIRRARFNKPAKNPFSSSLTPSSNLLSSGEDKPPKPAKPEPIKAAASGPPIPKRPQSEVVQQKPSATIPPPKQASEAENTNPVVAEKTAISQSEGVSAEFDAIGQMSSQLETIDLEGDEHPKPLATTQEQLHQQTETTQLGFSETQPEAMDQSTGFEETPFEAALPNANDQSVAELPPSDELQGPSGEERWDDV